MKEIPEGVTSDSFYHFLKKDKYINALPEPLSLININDLGKVLSVENNHVDMSGYATQIVKIMVDDFEVFEVTFWCAVNVGYNVPSYCTSIESLYKKY